VDGLLNLATGLGADPGGMRRQQFSLSRAGVASQQVPVIGGGSTAAMGLAVGPRQQDRADGELELVTNCSASRADAARDHRAHHRLKTPTVLKALLKSPAGLPPQTGARKAGAEHQSPKRCLQNSVQRLDRKGQAMDPAGPDG